MNYGLFLPLKASCTKEDETLDACFSDFVYPFQGGLNTVVVNKPYPIISMQLEEDIEPLQALQITVQKRYRSLEVDEQAALLNKLKAYLHRTDFPRS